MNLPLRYLEIITNYQHWKTSKWQLNTYWKNVRQPGIYFSREITRDHGYPIMRSFTVIIFLKKTFVLSLMPLNFAPGLIPRAEWIVVLPVFTALIFPLVPVKGLGTFRALCIWGARISIQHYPLSLPKVIYLSIHFLKRICELA